MKLQENKVVDNPRYPRFIGAFFTFRINYYIIYCHIHIEYDEMKLHF